MYWIGYLMKKIIKYTDEKQNKCNCIITELFCFFDNKRQVSTKYLNKV